MKNEITRIGDNLVEQPYQETKRREVAKGVVDVPQKITRYGLVVIFRVLK